MRSSAWTASGFALSQVIRFGANLILTRLLFPEAFGMMALVTVAMVGLANFSDVGIGPAILQNRRGDERAFLDTAWTIQVIRGGLLWLATCALARPVADFYGEPLLASILPVAGLSLLIAGFNPTRIETANRHLLLGRVILYDLICQVVGVVVMMGLAVATGSIWALVVGGLVSAAVKLALTSALLPGASDRFRLDPSAVGELLHFGKWIFFSTVCGFLIAQGDRVVLGRYLSLEMLGIYNIGYFLATAPLLLGGAIVGRISIPLYRESPSSAANTRIMRRMLTGLLLATLVFLAFAGIALVDTLYDARYAEAGAVVVLIACAQMPHVIGMTYDQAALAAGDARSFFLALAVKSLLFMTLFVLGAEIGGLVGALAGHAAALVAAYPMTVWLARRFGQWDPLHDALYGALAAGFGAAAIWLHWDRIAALASAGA